MTPYITTYTAWVDPAWLLLLGSAVLFLSLPRLIASIPIDGAWRAGREVATSALMVAAGVALTSWGFISLERENSAQFPTLAQVARHYGLTATESDSKGTPVEWRDSKGERYHGCFVRSVPLGPGSYRHVLLCTSVKDSQVVDVSGV